MNIHNEDEYSIEERKMASEEEMRRRGIFNKDGIDMYKKFDPKLKHLAARLYREGKSFSDIKNSMISSGLDKKNSEKLVVELQKWIKKRNRKQIILVSIGSLFSIVAILGFVTQTFFLGLAGGMIVGAILGAGLGALSPKNFERKDLYEIRELTGGQ